MTEMMPDKKGKLKLTLEIEVNEELMDLAKDAMEKMPKTVQGMMKKGSGEEKKE